MQAPALRDREGFDQHVCAYGSGEGNVHEIAHLAEAGRNIAKDDGPFSWVLMAARRARTSVVIGGGFVGLSCALSLQRIGRRVRLLDRVPTAHHGAASYGNAGTMAVYANVPVNSPSLLRKLPSCCIGELGLGSGFGLGLGLGLGLADECEWVLPN